MSNGRKLADLMVGTNVVATNVDSDLSTKINSIKTRLDSDDTKLQSLDTAIQAGIQNLADSDLIINQLQAKINSVISNVDSDSSFVQSINTQIDLIKSRLDSDDAKLQQVRTSIASEISATNTDVSSIIGRLDSDSSKLQQLDTSIVSVKTRLDSDDAAIQAATTLASATAGSVGVTDSDLKVVADLRNQLDSEIIFVKNFAISYTNYIYNSTAGQTSFTGNDANSATLAYTAGAIQVFLNGIRLEADDYTATDGTTVVLTEGAQLGHQVTIVCPKLESNYIPALNWGALSLVTVLMGGDGDGPAGNFGTNIDMAGDYIAVGAPGMTGAHYSGSVQAGGVFIYKRSDSEGGYGWPETTLIYDGNGLYPNADEQDQFGSSLAFTDENGDNLLVTNTNTSNSARQYKVYHYTRSGTTWSLAQTINAPTYGGASSGNQMEASNSDHGFGRDGRLSASGDYFVVGAPTDDAGGDNKGSAWMYYYSSGSYAIQQELIGSDNGDASRYGEQVCINGDVAVIGAPDQDKYDGYKGAAYVFTRSGSSWSQLQKIQPPTSGVHSDTSARKGMGKSVSIDGDYIAIGAHQSTVSTYTYAGKVYIYKWNGSSYVIDGSVTPSNPMQYGYFGQSCEIRGDVLIVGSYGRVSGYVFTRTGSTWTERKILFPGNTPFNSTGLGSTQQSTINKDTTKNEVILGANGKGVWVYSL